MEKINLEMSRRDVLRYGMVAGAAFAGWRFVSPAFAQPNCPPEDILPPPDLLCKEVDNWAHTPFIVSPFIDALPIPEPLVPGFRQPTGLPGVRRLRPWMVRRSQPGCLEGVVNPGRMTPGKQDSYGATHQFTPAEINAGLKPGVTAAEGTRKFPLVTRPLLYHIRLQVAEHRFTSSKVRPIDSLGNFLDNAALQTAGIPLVLDANGQADLPTSTIYGFNGTFPGPMINAEYGKPVIVRFENDLDLNPENLHRGDFGVPQFLTHLHNGHTAPESDGQPHYMQHNEGGYVPGDFVDNLYLNWPAGGDPSEMQSFLWFHDHRMHHTGANVYKGMVGLFPIYDPGVRVGRTTLPGTGLDPGDERKGLRLPGVRVRGRGGSFKVKYDIPMAFYDCRLDDGVAPHEDFRIGDPLIHSLPVADPGTCGQAHPELWGTSFFRYHPDQGFPGDLFTVNGIAFPVLNVFKRRYRFRWLDASVSRIYELCFMTSQNGPQAVPGSNGQWQIPDGQLWQPNPGTPNAPSSMTQIASMGGLLPNPILRDSIILYPATRREVIVDFTNANTGDVIYLTNIIDMTTGRLPEFDSGTPINNRVFKVPMVKIVVGGAPPERDNSVMPTTQTKLRDMPVLPSQAVLDTLTHRVFTLTRGGGDESQMWHINGKPFDPTRPLTEDPSDDNANPNGVGNPKRGTAEIWTVQTAGGWVHPMHMHQEEHTVLTRVGSQNPHPEDTGKEDVVNLDPGESVTFYRNFRTFTGPYVAHCHNLAHEDHNMMFGFTIDP